MTDERPRAYGEEARWRYYRGAAFIALGRSPEAEAELRAAVAADARQWVHGRAHLELGRIAVQQARMDAAASELHAAVRDCGTDHDPDCLVDARKLLQSIGGAE